MYFLMNFGGGLRSRMSQGSMTCIGKVHPLPSETAIKATNSWKDWKDTHRQMDLACGKLTPHWYGNPWKPMVSIGNGLHMVDWKWILHIYVDLLNPTYGNMGIFSNALSDYQSVAP